MKTPLRLALLALLGPTLAAAAECENAQPRTLALDFDGVTTVRFEVNANQLHLGAAEDQGPSFSARACASPAERLEQLVLTQRREGSTLVIRAQQTGGASGLFFKSTYAYLDLHAKLPVGLAYEVDVGSGDAWISGLKTVRVDVGSGDADLRGIFGTVDAKVGSGDIALDNIGALHVRSVGSGDLEAIRITGDVRVGDVGSGDLTLAGVAGDVEIASVGSGDADVSDVSGNLRVLRVGSGDVTTQGVRGRSDLPKED